jgi:hypothetical protein
VAACGHDVFPTWSLHSLPVPHMVPKLSWSSYPQCPGLPIQNWYVLFIWSLPGPYLVTKWSLPSLSGPNIIPVWSSRGHFVVPTCSLHSPLPVLVCLSIPSPYLVSTWSLSLVSIRSLSGLYQVII